MLNGGCSTVKRAGRVIVVAVCATVALFAFVSVAGAWEVTKSTNGVVINRETSDVTTTTVIIRDYYSYKGGTTWDTAFLPSSTTSYNSSRILYNSANQFEAIEVPLESGYRLHLVQLTISGGTTRSFCVVAEPLQVAVSNVSSVTVVSMPAVALESSVSVEGTLPVDVASVAGMSSGFLNLVGSSVGLLMGTGAGYVFSRRHP